MDSADPEIKGSSAILVIFSALPRQLLAFVFLQLLRSYSRCNISAGFAKAMARSTGLQPRRRRWSGLVDFLAFARTNLLALALPMPAHACQCLPMPLREKQTLDLLTHHARASWRFQLSIDS